MFLIKVSDGFTGAEFIVKNLLLKKDGSYKVEYSTFSNETVSLLHYRNGVVA
jgi:hypothetical protein